jgi:2-polyprenyl-3-methyl-5-hydroxy-6-metoxy-1,4-benzoquinol methylase
MLAHYDAHVSVRHLDVGVGTGWFLDQCRFPAEPQITLLDLNDNSLRATARRIQRYNPRTLKGNVLEPVDLGGARFDSVAMNFLLHCVPGPIEEKAATAIGNLRTHLDPGGVIFGSTILGRGVDHNAIGRTLQRVYNKKGIFSNLEDDAAGLQRALARAAADVEVNVVGVVALFSARG